jgi:hypothetical protein
MTAKHPLAVGASVLLISLALVMARADADPSDGSTQAAFPIPAPGTTVSNADGSCLKLTGLRDVVIQNVALGPCGGYGIELFDSQNVTIRAVTISGIAQSAIYIFNSSNVVVEESRITGGLSGVYAVESTGVRVECNTIEDPRGPVPRGQFVQFDKVTGAGNAIRCNAGRNSPENHPEDAVSLYKSRGTPQSPIVVADNLIVGGGPSMFGGGIMLGDDGGEYQVAERNDLVNPGQYGIAVASGNNMAIRNNRVYARAQVFTNVGISVWNQYPHKCSDISVEGNDVKWISKTGAPNPYWTGNNCGKVAGILNNHFRADLTPELLMKPRPAAPCSCQSQGRR